MICVCTCTCTYCFVFCLCVLCVGVRIHNMYNALLNHIKLYYNECIFWRITMAPELARLRKVGESCTLCIDVYV